MERATRSPRGERPKQFIYPVSAFTLTTATGGSSSSSSAAVNIFEKVDEDNTDEKEEGRGRYCCISSINNF